jgi:Mn2+/Fe2+ NRAMP family transporter
MGIKHRNRGTSLREAKNPTCPELVWAAINNGITAAPVMCFLMLMASNRKLMGKLTLPLYLKVLGWAATLLMALAAVGLLWP